MKRCPQCRRDYYDDSLLYCLDDGAPLLEGPSSGGMEAATVLRSSGEVGDAETLRQHVNPVTGGQTPGADGNNLVRESAPIKRVASPTTLGVLVLALALGGLAYGIYRLSETTTKNILPFSEAKLYRATNEGNIDSVTISPDGKYIAYVTIEGDKYTLWTKHLATDSRVQLLSVDDALDLHPSCFTPDSNYVVYGILKKDVGYYDIFQTPVLGGSSKTMLSATASPMISFSPDASKIAYSRADPASGSLSILIANADGTDERRLITSDPSESVGVYGTSWSPDGQTLLAVRSPVKGNMSMVAIRVADGITTTISEKKFSFIGKAKFLADGSGLVFVGNQAPGDSQHVWYMSYPAGECRRVTNDLSSYEPASLAVTADSRTIVAMQQQITTSAYVGEVADVSKVRRVSTQNDGVRSLNWVDNGRLFYLTGTDGGAISVLDPGSEYGRRASSAPPNMGMKVTPDGLCAIFLSDRSGVWELWRTTLDGGNPRQLTTGLDEIVSFSISPDSRWVLFSRFGGNIWRISIDGGQVCLFAETSFSIGPQLSPDGTTLATYSWDMDNKRVLRIFSVDGESAKLLRTINLPSTSWVPIRWSADGRSIVYTNTVGRISNLWQQPIAGGPAKKITNFTSETIVDFVFSQDGKSIAFAKGPAVSDAVLIGESK